MKYVLLIPVWVPLLLWLTLFEILGGVVWTAIAGFRAGKDRAVALLDRCAKP